jgi:hypothetical protein
MSEKKLTPQERKDLVKELRLLHQNYFDQNNISDAAYIPKMAFRPKGKDDLHIAFFESELKVNKDVYTEFISSEYISEDPKRTLYLHKYNSHWEEEYELDISNSGHERYLIPVSELKVMTDITDVLRKNTIFTPESVADLPNPDEATGPGLVEALVDINKTLKAIQLTLNSILNKK